MNAKKIGIAVGAMVALVVAILAMNYISVGRHARTVMNHPGNDVVRVWVHHPYLLDVSSLVIDLRKLEPNARPIDIARIFFDIAEQLKDREFRSVRLATHGETRFLIESEAFKRIGQERSFQNPLYALRTLPESLQNPDGTRAYGRWTGGLLGVMSKQMEDFNNFMRDWLRGL